MATAISNVALRFSELMIDAAGRGFIVPINPLVFSIYDVKLDRNFNLVNYADEAYCDHVGLDTMAVFDLPISEVNRIQPTFDRAIMAYLFDHIGSLVLRQCGSRTVPIQTMQDLEFVYSGIIRHDTDRAGCYRSSYTLAKKCQPWPVDTDFARVDLQIREIAMRSDYVFNVILDVIHVVPSITELGGITQDLSKICLQ